MHADYSLRLGDRRRIVVLADVFNLFDTQRIVAYDYRTETTFGVINPDFGQPVDPNTFIAGYQAPRQVRIGARFEF